MVWEFWGRVIPSRPWKICYCSIVDNFFYSDMIFTTELSYGDRRRLRVILPLMSDTFMAKRAIWVLLVCPHVFSEVSSSFTLDFTLTFTFPCLKIGFRLIFMIYSALRDPAEIDTWFFREILEPECIHSSLLMAFPPGTPSRWRFAQLAVYRILTHCLESI